MSICTELPSVINSELLKKPLQKLQKQYLEADPFPHIVFDNFLTKEAIKALSKSFTDSEDWVRYAHINNKTYAHQASNAQTSPILNDLTSEETLDFFSKLTGNENLIADKTFEGGGFMKAHQGDHINMHSDFLTHPFQKNWRRQINLLLYFNQDWNEDYGGYLEFWNKDMTKCVKKIAPSYNRAVIFATTPYSFHGYPEPLKCPPEKIRKSFGLYYYTKGEGAVATQATHYRPCPKDDFSKKMAINLDNKLLYGYSFLKSKIGIPDKVGCSIIKVFSRFKIK